MSIYPSIHNYIVSVCVCPSFLPSVRLFIISFVYLFTSNQHLNQQSVERRKKKCVIISHWRTLKGRNIIYLTRINLPRNLKFVTIETRLSFFMIVSVTGGLALLLGIIDVQKIVVCCSQNQLSLKHKKENKDRGKTRNNIR